LIPKKVLIIDDDPDLVLGLAVRLKANGYFVVSAVNASSGIEMKREHKPDLVILDLGLPGEDGFSVLEQMNTLAATPTIVLSGRNTVGNRERALNGGAVAFIQKPPENHALLSAVRLALGERIAISGVGRHQ
jgi:two-component system KDP operon response regulator KdpE